MNWSKEWSKPNNDMLIITRWLKIDGKQTEVTQIGDLAYAEDDEGFDIIHVPTLTRFNKAVPDGDCTKEVLLSWCHRVQLEHKDLWEILRQHDQTNYKDIPTNLLTSLRDHCLSVEV